MKKVVLMSGLSLLLWGCYPTGPDYVEDLDVVYTTYNHKFDFAGRSTYAMPDKIVIDVKIDRGDTTYEYMKAKYATPILASIDDNMKAKGWTKVDISKKPDVLITPGGVSSTTYYASYWYDWYYGGWYGGWYGWYYPPYYTVSSYTTGSLIIVMSDPNAQSESPIGRSQAAWVAAANGQLTGVFEVSRVTLAINDAFAQSPYLKTN